METVTVDLGERSYDIVIGQGLLAETGRRLKDLVTGRQVLVVTDANVVTYYGEIVRASLQSAGFEVQLVTIVPGESSKSWQGAECILSRLLQGHYHRDCTIIALGGGVVGDLAGFVASIYQRGVNFVQLPTSLLAQVDSSVGGKVAVNHDLGKNMIGAFYQPKAVWIDLDTLATLSQQHWQNGMAEVIKYGMIADAVFFEFLQTQVAAINERQLAPVAQMIATCCRWKATVVIADETERGLRAHLNFGHTIGHALEQATHYTGYLHGEAVAVGMVLATRYGVAQALCGEEILVQLQQLLRAYGLPIVPSVSLEITEVLAAMALDKKVEDDRWVMILPTAIGQVRSVKGIAPEAVRRLLESQVT